MWILCADGSRSRQAIANAAQAMGVEPAEFVEGADGVITRRNAFFHPLTLEDLEEEVAELQEGISPALRQRCGWECDVIANYHAIKQAFPGSFV